MFTRVCESQRCFFSLLSLKYITYSFSLSSVCLPCSSCLLLRSPGARPSVSLSPLFLPAVCPLPSPRPRGSFRSAFCVFPGCLLPFALSPSLPLSPSGAPREALWRLSVCAVVCRAACLLCVPSPSGGCRYSSIVRRKTA